MVVDGKTVELTHGKNHQWLGVDIKVPSNPNSNNPIAVSQSAFKTFLSFQNVV